jgi:hypothetical protein
MPATGRRQPDTGDAITVHRIDAGQIWSYIEGMHLRLVLSSLLAVAACAGPSQHQLAETPAAHSRPNPGEAPPASTSDTERAHMVQQFDDMQTTQRARQEASSPPAPPAPLPPAGTAPDPKKKVGPATKTPAPPKK